MMDSDKDVVNAMSALQELHKDALGLMDEFTFVSTVLYGASSSSSSSSSSMLSKLNLGGPHFSAAFKRNIADYVGVRGLSRKSATELTEEGLRLLRLEKAEPWSPCNIYSFLDTGALPHLVRAVSKDNNKTVEPLLQLQSMKALAEIARRGVPYHCALLAEAGADAAALDICDDSGCSEARGI